MRAFNKMDLKVQKARNGKGIFAARNFAGDEMLFEVTGPLVTCDEDEDMDDIERANTFRFDEDMYISPKGTIGDFQNHSCEPNAKVVKEGGRLFVLAAKTLKKGDEVLIDYSTIIAADDVWDMVCLCGTASCRGSIGSFDKLPRALQKKYKTDGIVPTYIVELSE